MTEYAAALSWEYLAYLKLLEDHPFDLYEEARDALELPLVHLLYSFYKLRSELPIEVDRMTHDGICFVYDSAGVFLEAGVNRVVGVIATSRETLSLESLLTRLREERALGLSTERTVEQIQFTVSTNIDAAPRRNFKPFCRALAEALNLEERPILQIVELVIAPSPAASPAEVARSRAVFRALRRAFRQVDSRRLTFELQVGQEVTDAVLQPLRIMAAADFPPGLRAELARELLGFYLASKEFSRRIAEPITDELIERMGQHLVPLFRRGSSRPRDSSAQREARLERGTVHAYDIGHFVPHAAGGPTKINFFYQERRLNRGWSAQGKLYRWMESYVSSHPGTLYLVRPIYEDLSDIPRYLEWGILLDGSEVERLDMELEMRPELTLLRPSRRVRGLQVVWLMARFANFPEGQSHLDLGVPGDVKGPATSSSS